MKMIHLSGDETTFSSYDRLTAAIVSVMKEKGDCQPSDLLSFGFSDLEMEENWSFAYHLALFEYDHPRLLSA